MSRGLCILACSLCLLGVGCGQKTPNPRTASLTPVISLLSPGLNSTTSADVVSLSGTSNMPAVYVAQSTYPVSGGKFDITLGVQPGENHFNIQAGNGLETSTLPVLVTRSTTTTAAETKPTVTNVKTTKTTTQQKTTAPAPTANQQASRDNSVPVSFSGTEMSLSVLLTTYGAQLDWTRASDPFQSYVVVKSTTDPNLYFPKQFWIQAFNNVDSRSWTDRNLAAGKTTYYRICKIKPDQSVVCGNIGHVTKP